MPLLKPLPDMQTPEYQAFRRTLSESDLALLRELEQEWFCAVGLGFRGLGV